MTTRDVPPYLKKRSKSLAKSLGTKQSNKSSCTIPKGLPDEKHGERVKAKIMLLYAKQDPYLDENHRQKVYERV
jgi:dienelactone hydrolase